MTAALREPFLSTGSRVCRAVRRRQSGPTGRATGADDQLAALADPVQVVLAIVLGTGRRGRQRRRD